MTIDLKDKLGRSPIYNDAGEVAMRHLRDNQRVLVACGTEKDRRNYVFHTRFTLCMSWVKECDAGCCLAVTGGCCGNRRPGIIVFANEDEIYRWTNGTRRP
jgi:hypothetical protein